MPPVTPAPATPEIPETPVTTAAPAAAPTANPDAAPDRIAIRRALISVYDKTGIVDLAAILHRAGVEIVSTGSTAATIAAAAIPVTPVEAVTGFPECLGGRVKTLHPRIHAGILADQANPDHRAQLADLDVTPFQLVICNLYPFAQTLAAGASFAACIEQIDIGGPSMVRAAAKNHGSVAVVVDPASYPLVAEAATGSGFSRAQRLRLAAQAFAHTATYDGAVANWLAATVTDSAAASDADTDTTTTTAATAATATTDTTATTAAATALFPATRHSTYTLSHTLRYGENPHQAGALYLDASAPVGLAQARLLHGKAMSYNNYTDGDAAWRAALDFDAPACAIIKHANPCGIAIGETIEAAHARAHACDPLSAFGGVIAVNRPVTAALAQQIAPIFTEVVIAPAFEPEALAILTAKKNLRLLELPTTTSDPLEVKPISGGLLVQQRDRIDAPGDSAANWDHVAGPAATDATRAELEFAWRAVRSVRSNAIILTADGASVGVGMGQVNRVDAAQLAVTRANTLGGEGVARARGAVAASDAFFPFADGLEILAEAGVRAIVEPGGSIRDDEVIAAAQRHGVSLYFTGVRHFTH